MEKRLASPPVLSSLCPFQQGALKPDLSSDFRRRLWCTHRASIHDHLGLFSTHGTRNGTQMFCSFQNAHQKRTVRWSGWGPWASAQTSLHLCPSPSTATGLMSGPICDSVCGWCYLLFPYLEQQFLPSSWDNLPPLVTTKLAGKWHLVSICISLINGQIGSLG